MSKCGLLASLGLTALAAGCSTSAGVNVDVSPAAAVEQDETDPCGCFTSGRWELDNSLVCVVDQLDPPHIYSSNISGSDLCEPSVRDFPQPVPGMDWSAHRLLDAPCTGTYELCMSVRAEGSDCELSRQCFEFEHLDGDLPTELPDIPAWSVQDEQCARDYLNNGGYIELTARSASLLCEDGERTMEVQDRLLDRITIAAPVPDADRQGAYGNLPESADGDAGTPDE